MTIDQLNKLTDEEVRVRVARAMGWTIDEPECEPWGWPPDPSYNRTIYGNGRIECLNYPADLNAAFTLVEKLRDQKWIVEITCSWLYNVSFVSLRRCDRENPDLITEGKSLARAICLSFLAVTEREEG